MRLNEKEPGRQKRPGFLMDTNEIEPDVQNLKENKIKNAGWCNG